MGISSNVGVPLRTKSPPNLPSQSSDYQPQRVLGRLQIGRLQEQKAVVPNYSLDVRYWHKADGIGGQSMSALPQFSDVDLLGYGKRIVHLDP